MIGNNAMAFFLMSIVMTASLSQVKAQAICPLDVAPCECSDRGDGTLNLDCYNRGLGQEKTSEILQSFLQPGISPLSWLQLAINGLTVVPTEIAQFPQLRELGLDRQGVQMLTVPQNAFPNSLIFLDLSFNGIPSIEPGALNGNYEDLIVNDNLLSRFESSVFQPPMEKMIPSDGGSRTGYLRIGNNAFDCDTDPCHMAWLIRDNRNLFAAFDGMPACNNGLFFDQLNPKDPRFNNCPFTCPLYTNGAFPHPYSCSYYYICIDSVPFPQTCTFPLVFNPVTKYCDTPANVPGCN